MSPLKARGRESNVMVVDDNPANLKLMGDMLGLQGYEVRLFPRGRLALASAAQRPPDLVLLDINMPEMDGLQLLAEIKQRYPDLPVMMVTAYGDEGRRRLAAEYGAADFVTKPVDFDQLKAQLRQLPNAAD